MGCCDPPKKITDQLRLYFTVILTISFLSCTIYDNNLDNPNDNEANEELGVYPPSLVFFPKQQTKTLTDTIRLGAYVVFSDTSITSFSGAHLNIQYDNALLEIDSLAPGWIGPGSMTDSNRTTPLFTYIENSGQLDIYAYYLSTSDVSIDSVTHIAEIWFKPKALGTGTVSYDTSLCEIVKFDENFIPINGTREAYIIIQ